jgi:hypothetical protein
MSVWLFGAAAFLALPKQYVSAPANRSFSHTDRFALVYIGKIIGDLPPKPLPDSPSDEMQAHYDAEKAVKDQQKKISLIVLGATVFLTSFAAYIVWMRARAYRPIVIARMEARRLAQMEEAALAAEDAAGGGSPATTGADDIDDDAPSTTAAHRKANMHLDLIKPPEFADMIKWENSRGSLRTPTGADRTGPRTSMIGMSLDSPSLPHLPKYTSRLVNGDELLLAGRPRTGTMSSRASTSMAPDYFGAAAATTGAGQSSVRIEADVREDDEETPGSPTPPAMTDARRRQSEPNWEKGMWE